MVNEMDKGQGIEVSQESPLEAARKARAEAAVVSERASGTLKKLEREKKRSKMQAEAKADKIKRDLIAEQTIAEAQPDDFTSTVEPLENALSPKKSFKKESARKVKANKLPEAAAITASDSPELLETGIELMDEQQEFKATEETSVEPQVEAQSAPETQPVDSLTEQKQALLAASRNARREASRAQARARTTKNTITARREEAMAQQVTETATEREQAPAPADAANLEVTSEIQDGTQIFAAAEQPVDLSAEQTVDLNTREQSPDLEKIATAKDVEPEALEKANNLEFIKEEVAVLETARERSEKAERGWFEAMKSGAVGIANRARELLSKATKGKSEESFERFNAPSLAAEAGKFVVETPVEGLVSGAKIAGETLSRRQELATAINQVMNSFGGLYYNIRDRMSGEQRRWMEQVMRDPETSAVNAYREKEVTDLTKDRDSLKEQLARAQAEAAEYLHVIQTGSKTERAQAKQDHEAANERVKEYQDKLHATEEALNNPDTGLEMDWFVNDRTLDMEDVEEEAEIVHNERNQAERARREHYRLGRALNMTEDLVAGANEMRKFVGEGLVDFGEGYAKMFDMMGEATRGEREKLDAAESALQTEVLEASEGRTAVAAQETRMITEKVVNAREQHVAALMKARDNFERHYLAAEEEAAQKLNEIQSGIGGPERDDAKKDLDEAREQMKKYESAFKASVKALKALESVTPEAQKAA